MIRVTVTGSECTGKTTLAAALAAHYDSVCVPEFARDFVERKRSALDADDVEAIARAQIERQRELGMEAEGLLILDTDLLSTFVYSCHYYGGCAAWIDRAVGEKLADLYLLAGIDVLWVADGLQRDRGHRRHEMHELFREELVARGADFIEVRGPHAERLEAAIAAIDRLL